METLWIPLAVLIAILSHIFYFHRGQHHLWSFFYLQLTICFPPAATILLSILTSNNLIQSARIALSVELIYLLSMFTSMVLYRITPLHRLYNFPGPISWRITKLAQMGANSDLQSYKHLQNLHETYGDYVRTGPSEISVIDPNAIIPVHGPASKCIRSAWYELADPLLAIFHTVSRKDHDRRRRLWEKGLSMQALQTYEKHIDARIQQLARRISEMAEAREVVNVTHWLNFMSFDIMGDVGFGKGFGMLESGQKIDILRLLEDGMRGLGVGGSVPWLFMLLRRVPSIKRDYERFLNWCGEQMWEREKRNPEHPDIAAPLIAASSEYTDPNEARRWLAGDSRIIVVAGSDAMASTLTFALYYLANDPSHADIIRAELKNLGADLNAKALQSKATYLNAFITEVLRLWPANPSGFLRDTPKEGIRIGNRWIPGATTICTPLWCLHRSPRSYVLPLDFIPERWTTRPELVLHKGAYLPFGYGPYGCVGKQLALMEVRLCLARLVMGFDIGFADAGQDDGSALLNDSKDWFTIGCADLRLKFERR